MRSGNKLKSRARKAISTESASIVDIKNRYYKKHELQYVVKLAKINRFKISITMKKQLAGCAAIKRVLCLKLGDE